MAPRGIYHVHESPGAGLRNSEMISPSPTFPENAAVELLRERSRRLCCLNHDFFPLHMLAQLSIPEWADLPAPVSLRENAANAPFFLAFCCPFIDLDAIFVSRLRNMGRLHHAPKSLGMAKDKFPFHDCCQKKSFANGIIFFCPDPFGFHLFSENDSMHTTLTNRVMQSDLSASPPTPFPFFVSAFPSLGGR